MPVSCVLSAVLGNRTLSRRLLESVSRTADQAEALWFDESVYRSFPAPKPVRYASTWESVWVARRWLREQTLATRVIVNGYPLALAANHPAMAVALDVTPAMLPRRSLAGGLANRLLDRYFRRVAARVRAWLPISATVQASLVNDYGIGPQRCFVTRAPQLSVDPHPHEPSGKLLFVGNDLVRKGGDRVVAALEALPEFSLTIVSNDPLAGAIRHDRVRVVQGIRDPQRLAAYYREADLLILPTSFDSYPQVICEAAAQGIPSLATRVGSIGELLDESGGASLEEGSPAEVARAVREVFNGDYLSRAKKAAAFARAKLSTAALDQAVTEALSLLD